MLDYMVSDFHETVICVTCMLWYRLSLLWYPWAWQMSWDVLADEGLLCEEAFVFKDMTKKGTFCRTNLWITVIRSTYEINLTVTICLDYRPLSVTAQVTEIANQMSLWRGTSVTAVKIKSADQRDGIQQEKRKITYRLLKCILSSVIL